MPQKIITDDLDAILEALPTHIVALLRERDDKHELLEVVMDLGRPPEARFPGREVVMSEVEVTDDDIQYVISRIGEFSDDNRAGIERTLHRISRMCNRQGRVVGLTCRVGRAVYGTIRVIEDLVTTGKSILLLGRPGVGKTTMLREVARVLADDLNKRVIIVDTSNEIAGDGDIPHPAIGKARRMQVPTPSRQHAVMIEAVENHMPEVIIIDEIGTELDASAARTIAERGVQLVATAHGNTLQNLVLNPTLSDLVGGVQTVILSDEEARRRRTQKAILERKAPPTFDVVVEIQSWERVAVHPDVAKVVDKMLRGAALSGEIRYTDEEGVVRTERAEAEDAALPSERFEERAHPPREVARLFPFGVDRARIEQVVRHARLPVEVVRDLKDADMLLTTRTQYKRHPKAVKDAEEAGRPVYVLRKNSLAQIEQFLRALGRRSNGGRASSNGALEEAEEAVEQVLDGEEMVELSPQSSYVRRLQHLLARQYNLRSVSSGNGPNRRVTVYRASHEV
ncbi:MAG: AAA family ATPase [Chloroflexi bacterium]|nr:AAA family ATPase [Chloroflexota bacterium]